MHPVTEGRLFQVGDNRESRTEKWMETVRYIERRRSGLISGLRKGTASRGSMEAC